jgi:porin
MNIRIALSGLASALTLTATIALPTVGSAQSQETAAAPPWSGGLLERKNLTGDWAGLRPMLTDKGINFDFRLSQYGQSVASGGAKKQSVYGGTLDYRLHLEGQKLGLWPGLDIFAHARTRWGKDISAAAGPVTLANAGLLMPLPGEFDGTEVTGLMVSQTWSLNDRLLGNALVGKLDVIDLVTGFFPDAGYGQEGFWNVSNLASAMPWFGGVAGLSLYGGIFETINKKYGIAESGIIAAGTENVSDNWDSPSKSFDDGVWLAAFHRQFWDWQGKMGYFMVFGGYSTKDQASSDPHDFAFKPNQGIVSDEQKNPWDIALYLHQDFWQSDTNPARKANVHIGGTFGSDNPQFSDWNLFGTVTATGLIESRPHDRMGFGAFYNGVSSNYKDLVSPVADLGDMWGAEAYYNIELIPSVHLTGDVQYVQDIFKDDDPALIGGLRLVIDF